MFDFPDEILSIIASYLNVSDLTSFARCCKKFGALMNEDHFWKLMCLQSGTFCPMKILRVNINRMRLTTPRTEISYATRWYASTSHASDAK